MKMLQSYIANVNKVRDYHLAALDDLAERQFPGILSNEIHPKEYSEWPNCPESIALETMGNRISMLRDDRLHFFLLFIDDSQNNDIAAFELGMAINNPNCLIVLIGEQPKSAIHNLSFEGRTKIVRAYDYDNFLYQRFP